MFANKDVRRFYTRWRHILRRCLDPKNKSYHRYGGRGVTICERWRSWKNFLADVGLPPVPNLQIDRIDNDGNYEPGNVRWATMREQQLNSSNVRMATHNGETKCLKDWAVAYGIKYSTLQMRLSRGWSIDKALTQKIATTSRVYRKKVAHA